MAKCTLSNFKVAFLHRTERNLQWHRVWQVSPSLSCLRHWFFLYSCRQTTPKCASVWDNLEVYNNYKNLTCDKVRYKRLSFLIVMNKFCFYLIQISKYWSLNLKLFSSVCFPSLQMSEIWNSYINFEKYEFHIWIEWELLTVIW